MSNTVTIFFSFLGSAGVCSLIQFLIKRHDERKGILAELRANLEKLERMFLDAQKNSDRKDADSSRRSILAAADELRTGITLHSKEWFDQLTEDVDVYERYCIDNPKYRNDKATQSIAFIRSNYAKRLEQDDFL